MHSANEQLEVFFHLKPVCKILNRLLPGVFGLALVPQGVLVKQVLCHLVGVGIHAGEVGDVVAQLLDGLHLLVQVVGLQEVTQLRTHQRTNVRFGKGQVSLKHRCSVNRIFKLLT